MPTTALFRRLGVPGAPGALTGCATAIDVDPQERLFALLRLDRDAHARCLQGRGSSVITQ